MFQRRPALRFVLLFAVGILLAAWISISPLEIFVFALITIFIISLLFLYNKEQLIINIFLRCLVILAGFLLQTIQYENHKYQKLYSVVENEQVVILGTVDSHPIYKERKISFVVESDSIIRYGNRVGENHRLLILLYPSKSESPTKGIKFGEQIELSGIIKPFPFQRNPGEFDYGKYLELNQIQGIVSAKGMNNLKIIGSCGSNSIQSWTYSIQHALYRILDSLHTPRHAGFLKGIIFGYRAEISEDVKQSFIDTGTIHILAVSGSNVAFVAFMFFAVFGFFRLSRRTVGGITIFGLIVYMLITGASPSVVRATIMAIVILCGTLFERKTDIYNSISVAALVLLIWDTNVLFDIGFQLSFSAVISIVFFYPRLEMLIKKIPERFEEIKGIDVVLKLFAVSLTAQLGTIPFTAYYFGRISIVSLIANLLVVPISGLNTFIGFAEVLFYYISPWLAGLYASANDFMIWFLLGFVKQSANVPYAYLEIGQLNVTAILGYYLILIGLFYINLARVRVWLIIMALMFCNYLIYSAIWNKNHPDLAVTMLDIGQGDAILTEFPNGNKLLIDTGPASPSFDAGEKIVIPFLKRYGITEITYLLITHPHSDHLGGAKSIIKSIQVDTLLMAHFSKDNSQFNELLRVALARKTAIKNVGCGDQIQIDENARVYVLFPSMTISNERNANNSSVVLKIIYGISSILLEGDAEIPVENKMVSRYDEFLSSNILKAGHHGSITSTSEEFLNNVHPQIVLISVGNQNKFRHPSPSTINRLAAHSVKIERTDKSGAVIYQTDGSRWTKRDWKDAK
jgi:competence protein ComEC